MKVTTIGRGSIGGTLGKLWTAAGHEVALLGHEGGDASDADVVLLAPLYDQVPDALGGVTGLDGKIILDATNRLGGEDPPSGYASNAEFAKAQTGGPTAKVFNANFGKLLEQAGGLSARPTNLWVGDEEAREAVEQLSRDAGFEARNAGPIESARLQEEFAQLLMGVVNDAGGLVFYRFATPEEF
jgi:predicted dinucleotide-binding enzyme